jgi:hypothetical protein
MMFTLILLAIYFAPTIQAISAHKKNWQAIAVLNLFLGWTLIGWVVAFSWAATKD